MRLLGLTLGLLSLVLITFLLWGESLAVLFSPDATIAWLSGSRSWAWAAGIALLAADLVLPLPGTIIMAGLGYVYGPLVGGLISAAGSILSGAIAYGLCRRYGRGVALRLVGRQDMERSRRLFESAGGWLVALSRWMPLLPEVVACLAGVSNMPPRLFLLALACGSVPFGFAFAAVGAAGVSNPALALALSAALPGLLWLVVQLMYRRRSALAEP
jgi:uncharacterized membrane protein YdjX (TVP38/TMEM64 family)